MHNMDLPLRIFYTPKEAALLLNEKFNRSDIDESYFFQLAIKGVIRLGLFTDTSHIKYGREYGTLCFDWYEGSDDAATTMKHAIAVTDCLSAIEESGSILILNDSSVKGLYLRDKMPICDIRLDNIFSMDSQECCIPDEILESLFYFEYADKLHFSECYEGVYFYPSSNEIEYAFNEEDGKLYLSLGENPAEDWKSGFWFKRKKTEYKLEDKFSDRIITKDECVILGEDIQLLLEGKQRKSTQQLKRNVDRKEIKEANLKPHPKRVNSINEIIFSLARKASLDLSQHQSAYAQLESYCDSLGLKLPNKDTCGKLFKEAYENSKFHSK